MKKNIIIVLLILSFSNLLGQNNKIAPAFKYLLTHPYNAETAASYPALYHTETVNGLDATTGLYAPGYMCIIYTTNPTALIKKGIVIQSVLPKFVTAWIQLHQITSIAAMEDVKYIDAPKVIMPSNDISVGTSGAALLHSGNLNNTTYKGDGVIVGVYDTGIDWLHLDFRSPSDTTKSRILRIWDHTITPINSEISPTGFTYGVEYTQTQINDELDGTPTGFVRERDYNQHGTHVTGTAAGNGASLASRKFSGIAPNADIVVVKGGNSFFNYPSQIDAMTYFKNIANFYNKPLVVNMSIGGQFGAHDGTAPNEVAVDNFSNSGDGRVAVIAAGNDNGKTFHKRLALNSNSNGNIIINLPAASGTTAVDLFQFSLYVNDTSAVTATLTDPNGGMIVTNPNQNIIAPAMNNNATVYFDNEIDIESGDRLINVYITRKTASTNASGTWTLNINNISTNNITMDGWLNFRGADYGSTSIAGADGNYQIHSPGCANSAITVASYVGKLDWYSTSTTSPGGYAFSGTQQDNISTFSSIGPRRDDVLKPTIAANGQGVISCTSLNAAISLSSTSVVVANKYHILSGTSMATPEVAGCVALLLQVKNNATYNEIKNAITNTATKDIFTTSSNNPIWGYGKIDVFSAASTLATCTTFKRATYSYDSSTTSSNNSSFSLGAAKAATRFTPTINGKLGGVYFKTGTAIPTNGFTIEVRTNSSGNPATLLGSMSIATSSIAKFSWNYYDVSSLNITVTNGTDYFVVLVPGTGDSWNLGYENLSNSGRSFYSNGASWTAYNDFRIRTVIYDNSVPSNSSTTNLRICNSELPYNWNGLTFTNAGSQTAHLTNIAGCDSAATLNLLVKVNSSSSTNLTINSTQLPYSWNGLIFTVAGSQTAHLINALGCDSAASLNLSVNTNIALAITGPNSVCVNSSITLNTNIAGGVWSSVAGRATVSALGVVTGTSAGTATITYVVTNNGVVKSASYNVVVNGIPAVPLIAYAAGSNNPQYGAPSGGFCVGKPFVVVGNPSGGTFIANGSISVNHLGNAIVNTIGSGSLTYTYTNLSGCKNSRTLLGTGYTCASRGISNEQLSIGNTDFIMYPNPTNSQFTILQPRLIGAGSIVMTDLYGKSVKTQLLSMGTNTIDISKLNNGIYFVSVITNEGKTTKKLIVE
ncbi:MAG: S8 family serine peptidase [Chitinophagaceae bacterium]